MVSIAHINDQCHARPMKTVVNVCSTLEFRHWHTNTRLPLSTVKQTSDAQAWCFTIFESAFRQEADPEVWHAFCWLIAEVARNGHTGFPAITRRKSVYGWA